MSRPLRFPLECPSWGNFQFFKEVRHEVHLAATHGQVEYGKPENASLSRVLRNLCGFFNARVHDNEVAEPAVPDWSAI